MTDTPQPLPSAGGSYIRTDKGELVPAPIVARPEPEKAPRKPAVKEG